LTENVLKAATAGEADHHLTIRGADVAELAIDFRAKLAAAVVAGDFTNILSPNRSFIVLVAGFSISLILIANVLLLQ
jgi:hypothetical protein